MPYNHAMHRTRGWIRAGAWALSGCVLVTATGCAPPAITGGFDSPHAASRLFAARRAAAETDPARIAAAMPGLIRNLDSDDPAVRLLSIEALEELTGETFGYRHFDPEWLRAPAVARWAAAWEGGEVRLRDGAPVGPDTLGAVVAAERTAIER